MGTITLENNVFIGNINQVSVAKPQFWEEEFAPTFDNNHYIVDSEYNTFHNKG